MISANFDKQFMNLHAVEFLDNLTKNLNIKKVVFGTDYTCGVRAEFKSQDVKKYFESKNIQVEIVDLLMGDNGKVASREIRELLKNGKICEVNKLLPYPFFVSGVVEKGRNVGGNVVGYPTANIPFPADKVELKALSKNSTACKFINCLSKFALITTCKPILSKICNLSKKV
mgnify:CR=1 FL=1